MCERSESVAGQGDGTRQRICRAGYAGRGALEAGPPVDGGKRACGFGGRGSGLFFCLGGVEGPNRAVATVHVSRRGRYQHERSGIACHSGGRAFDSGAFWTSARAGGCRPRSERGVEDHRTRQQRIPAGAFAQCIDRQRSGALAGAAGWSRPADAQLFPSAKRGFGLPPGESADCSNPTASGAL